MVCVCTCDFCEVEGNGATAVLNRMRCARVGGEG